MQMRSLGWALVRWDCVLLGIWTQRETHREIAMLDLTLPQAKEPPRSPANHQKLGEEHGTDSHSPRKEPTLARTSLQTSGVQSHEATDFCCLNHVARGTCDSSSRKPIYLILSFPWVQKLRLRAEPILEPRPTSPQGPCAGCQPF